MSVARRTCNRACGYLACAVMLGSAPAARASLRFWDGGGTNNNWSTSANWASFFGVPANDGTDDVIMQGTLRPTPNVDIDFDILSLQFSGGGSAGPFSITNSGGADLFIRNGGVVNNDTDLQTIGRIVLGANHAWNAASGPLRVTFATLGSATPRMLTVTGAFDTTITGAISGSNLTGAGSIILNSSANLQLGGTQGMSSNTFTGPIVVNSGTLLLNKFDGGIAVPGNLIIGDGAGGDVVKLLRSNQIADTSNVAINGSGWLDLNGFTDRFADLTMTGGTLSGGGVTITGAITTNASADPARITVPWFGGNGVAFTVADGAAVDDLIVTTEQTHFVKSGPGQMRFAGTAFMQVSPVGVTVNEGTLVLGVDSFTLGALTVGDGIGGARADVARLSVTQMFPSSSSIHVDESGFVDFDGHSQFPSSTTLRGGELVLGNAMLKASHFSSLASSSTALASGGSILLDDPQQGLPAFLTVADGPAAVDLEITSTLASSGGLIIAGSGAVVLSGSQSHAAGSLLINGGTVTFDTDAGGAEHPPMTSSGFVHFASTQHLASLDVTGGKTELVPGGSRLLMTSALTVDTADALIDVWEHAVIVDYSGASPLAALRSAIVSARNGGAWNGFGITSSVADATHAVGYAENSILNLTSFEGESVDATTVLIKFTFAGDTNLDGQVDITDLGNLATAWQSSGAWTSGDSDYSGFVDITDLGLLATNWQAGVSNPLEPSLADALATLGLPAGLVPEPASVFVVGLLPMLTYRRRASRNDRGA